MMNTETSFFSYQEKQARIMFDSNSAYNLRKILNFIRAYMFPSQQDVNSRFISNLLKMTLWDISTSRKFKRMAALNISSYLMVVHVPTAKDIPQEKTLHWPLEKKYDWRLVQQSLMIGGLYTKSLIAARPLSVHKRTTRLNICLKQ